MLKGDSAQGGSETILSPHHTICLPEDPAGIFARNELWAVYVFHLLGEAEAEGLIHLAEQHAEQHGWSTGRHKHYPTTDIAVTPHTAALHAALSPIVTSTILPTLANHYAFAASELRIRDLFVVKYEAGAAGVQDRLNPHRDGNLLSFSILLSKPTDFDGGGLRFHSLGPECDACSPSAHRMGCPRCNGVGRLTIPHVGRGDLTAHCGKLLHEGAPVVRGRRYVVVGFVIVDSPRVNAEFLANSRVANMTASGAKADHVCVGTALFSTQAAPAGCPGMQPAMLRSAPVDEQWTRSTWSGESEPERGESRGGEDDLSSQMFGM